MQIEVTNDKKSSEERYAYLIRVALVQIEGSDDLFRNNFTEMLENMANLMHYDMKFIKSLLIEHYDAQEDLFDGYSKSSLFQLCLSTKENPKIIDALEKLGALFDEWCSYTGLGNDLYRN